MIMLKYADYMGKYHGFNLKPGFYYGIDTETEEYVAASGRENSGEAAIYYRHGKKWIMKWIPAEDIRVSNLPQINVSDKMSFVEYLTAERGIVWPDWDENYFQIAMAQIKEKYDLYYYSGIPAFPAFAKKFLQKENQTAIGRWIPCSERLPEIGERVLVITCLLGKITGVTFASLIEIQGKTYWNVKTGVVAWQPLSG